MSEERGKNYRFRGLNLYLALPSPVRLLFASGVFEISSVQDGMLSITSGLLVQPGAPLQDWTQDEHAPDNEVQHPQLNYIFFSVHAPAFDDWDMFLELLYHSWH